MRKEKQAGASGGGILARWGSEVARWANERLAKWSAGLEEARHREISRLLNMLDTDPQNGLRYAIPLSDEPGRGRGTPSSRLAERNVNFQFGGRRGAVDPWNISDNYRQRLMTRYHELANREIALGRHRRAAYIFAQLLGDFVAAARTLADGGHFREAAVLYEEKLGQPLEAARTFERGSLWTEAITIYERLGHDEQVGDLYRQLDQPDVAAAAYHREVAKKLRADDRLAAARLLEAKLADPAEALVTLVNAWPDSPQAIRCVDALFQLLARGGDHPQAARQVRRLAQCTAGRVALGQKLALSLAALAETYPSRDVRSAAADQTRLLAAEHLPQATGNDLLGLTEALRKLAPHDLLLRRDTQRFVQRSQPRGGQAIARKPTIAFVRSIQLTPAKWMTLLGSGNEFFAAGVLNKHYIVARGSWQGQVQCASQSSWVKPGVNDWPPLLLAVHEPLGPLVLHPFIGQQLIEEAVIPPTSDLPRTWLSVPTLGLAVGTENSSS